MKGDNCSFRHETNECAKSTQPNPSPGSSTQQSVKNASRTRSAVFMWKNYMTIGLRISGFGAAEVFIDIAEELKHTEANPMCSTH